jgi:hypothetical protein
MTLHKNQLTSWIQGCFIDGPEYDHLTAEDKKKINEIESHFVRPHNKGNHICFCDDPADALWITERLNFAAKIENKKEKETK